MPRYPSEYYLKLPYGLAQACGGCCEGAIVAYLLWRGGRPTSLRQVEEHTGVPMSTAKGMVSRLLRAGLLDRDHPPGFAPRYREGAALQPALDAWASAIPPIALGR